MGDAQSGSRKSLVLAASAQPSQAQWSIKPFTNTQTFLARLACLLVQTWEVRKLPGTGVHKSSLPAFGTCVLVEASFFPSNFRQARRRGGALLLSSGQKNVLH